MKRRYAYIAAATLACGLILVNILGDDWRSTQKPVEKLVIATGGRGGVYYQFGGALAEAAGRRWHTKTRVLATAAAVENLKMVANGEADVGFTTIDAASLALSGSGDFAEPQPITALGWIYDDYLQIVVRADGPIRDIAGLRGRRVSTGAPGSGTEIVAERVLEVASIDINSAITRRRLGVTESADALRARKIDAFFFTGGLPTPAIAELGRGVPIQILSLTAGQVNELQDRYGEVYPKRTISSTTYHLDEQVSTIGIPNVLVVREDMRDDIARQLTALLFEAKPQLVAAHPEARHLDPRAALGTFPVPLHPGAMRYYREAKTMEGG